MSLRNELGDVNFNVIFGTAAAVAYSILFTCFVIFVMKEFKILHGYPRFSELRPGEFVSDRYTWGWYFLMLNGSRPLLFSFYVWCFLGLRSQGKRIWFERMVGYYMAFDVVLWIFFFVVTCFLCNNSFHPAESSLCNDSLSRWCSVWGDSFPDRCPPSSPISDQCDLKPNETWIRWIYFHIGFSVLDLLLWSLNSDMRTYVDRVLFYSSDAFY